MFNFPAGPIVGQKYPTAPTGSTPQYMWDGEKWVGLSTGSGGGGGGGASVSTQDTPPIGPADGDLWWESDTGTLYVAYADATSTQWVSTATPATGWFVSKVGDVMSGGLRISPAAGAFVVLNKGSTANANAIEGWTNGQTRWAIQPGNGNAESGANAGSDFGIYRYADDGTLIDMPLGINRKSGSATFLTQLNVNSIVGSGQLQSRNSFSVNMTTVASTAGYYGHLNGVLRWGLFLGNGIAETGANAGSDFQINGYSDNGQTSYVYLQMNRKTGGTIFYGGINVNNTAGIVTAGGISASGVVNSDGYVGRAGQSGATNGYIINTNWTSTTLDAWVGQVRVGAITMTSDYRVKKDVTPLDSMWAKLKALNPIRFTWKDYTPPEAVPDQGEVEPRPLVVGNDIEQWGFLAHELQETLTPSAASGAKDEVNLLQSPNPWTIIAALTKTVQEMQARIETLEAKVA